MATSVGGRNRAVPYINVTPLIDVLLVVLIIFMVVTPFLQQGVTVPIPRNMKNPEEDQAINKETSVILSIVCRKTVTNVETAPPCSPEDTDYYIGKKKVNLDDLKSQVEKALATKKEEDKIVYIKSGSNVSYGEVVKVINAVREKGVDKIGLVTDKLKKGATAAPPTT